MNFKQTLKMPIFQLLILKNNYSKTLEKLSTPETLIAINSEGVVISSDDEDLMKTTSRKVDSEIIQKLNYYQILLTRPSGRHYWIESPTILSKIHSNGCQISSLTSYVYISSLSKTAEEIKKLMEIFQKQEIWCIPYRNQNHYNPLYSEITLYLYEVLKNKEKQFQKLGVTVEIGIGKSHFLLWGRSSSHKMQVKHILKGIIYSITIFQIKTGSSLSHFNKLKLYLKQVSDHPIVFSKTQQSVYCLVTKDSIALQLLSRPKLINFMNLNKSNDIGIFFVQNLENGVKKQIAQTVSTQFRFYIKEEHSLTYFINSFQEQQEKQHEYKLKLIKTIIQKSIDKKPKYESSLRKDNRKKNQENFQQFVHEADWWKYESTLELASKFGCDLRIRKVYVNSKYLLKYESFKGEQRCEKLFSKVDWCPPDRVQVWDIENRKMKGVYFYGRMKLSEEGRLFLPEHIIEVI